MNLPDIQDSVHYLLIQRPVRQHKPDDLISLTLTMGLNARRHMLSLDYRGTLRPNGDRRLPTLPNPQTEDEMAAFNQWRDEVLATLKHVLFHIHMMRCVGPNN